VNLALDPLPPPAHLPRLALEEAVAGPVAPTVSAHLAECAGCRGYVDVLRGNSARFLAAHPSDRFLAQLDRREARPARGWIPLAGVAAAMAVGGLVAFTFWRDSPGPTARAGVQFKGALVSPYVQRQNEAVPLRAGDELHPKDAVRFVVRAQAAGYAAVLERDPQGRVTVVAPFGAGEAQAVGTGSTALPDSAILDSTVGTDRFVAVLSPHPLALGPIVEALAAGRPIDCSGCQVELLDFDKRP
jgi:hypothetical protein